MATAAHRTRVTRMTGEGETAQVRNVFGEEARSEQPGATAVLSADDDFSDSLGASIIEGAATSGTELDDSSVAVEEPTPATDAYGNPLGRGGFARDGRGSAKIMSPNPDEVYKSGPNKGQRKFLPYKAASSVVISTSTEGLDAWKQQRLMMAFARDPELNSRFLAAMSQVDPDDDDAVKAVLNEFRAEAHEIADTQLAAERGTFAHWLTECEDNGESPLDGLEKGEAIGIDREMAERIAKDWKAINTQFGFKSTAVEAKIVNDDLRAAGTTDRVIELEKPLTFEHKGQTVTLPVGTTLIGDLKTGKLRLDRNGKPQYWQKYSGQLAAYAGGVPYDPYTAERKDWSVYGGRPSQDYGIIIHGDLEAMSKGKGESFRVFVVDLEEGRQLAAASNLLREREKSAGASVAPVAAI